MIDINKEILEVNQEQFESEDFNDLNEEFKEDFSSIIKDFKK